MGVVGVGNSACSTVNVVLVLGSACVVNVSVPF